MVQKYFFTSSAKAVLLIKFLDHFYVSWGSFNCIAEKEMVSLDTILASVGKGFGYVCL